MIEIDLSFDSPQIQRIISFQYIQSSTSLVREEVNITKGQVLVRGQKRPVVVEYLGLCPLL
jgi:hypothetical protein